MLTRALSGGKEEETESVVVEVGEGGGAVVYVCNQGVLWRIPEDNPSSTHLEGGREVWVGGALQR